MARFNFAKAAWGSVIALVIATGFAKAESREPDLGPDAIEGDIFVGHSPPGFLAADGTDLLSFVPMCYASGATSLGACRDLRVHVYSRGIGLDEFKEIPVIESKDGPLTSVLFDETRSGVEYYATFASGDKKVTLPDEGERRPYVVLGSASLRKFSIDRGASGVSAQSSVGLHLKLESGSAPGEAGIAIEKGEGQSAGPADFVVVDGTLYLLDSENHRVQIFDPNGELIGQIAYEIESPSSVAVWGSELVLANSTDIQTYSLDGRKLRLYSGILDRMGGLNNQPSIKIQDGVLLASSMGEQYETVGTLGLDGVIAQLDETQVRTLELSPQNCSVRDARRGTAALGQCGLDGEWVTAECAFVDMRVRGILWSGVVAGDVLFGVATLEDAKAPLLGDGRQPTLALFGSNGTASVFVELDGDTSGLSNGTLIRNDGDVLYIMSGDADGISLYRVDLSKIAGFD